LATFRRLKIVPTGTGIAVLVVLNGLLVSVLRDDAIGRNVDSRLRGNDMAEVLPTGWGALRNQRFYLGRCGAGRGWSAEDGGPYAMTGGGGVARGGRADTRSAPTL
jgi:hypothetical protein